MDDSISRKIDADIFIDDRNVGGFPGWGEVYKSLYPEGDEFSHILTNADAHYNKAGKVMQQLKRLFGVK